MAASHPTALKTFTTKTDKVDLVAAAHINDIQLEIVQMQEGPQIGTSFPGTPADGWMFYRTDLNALYIYNGAAWDQISSPFVTDDWIVAASATAHAGWTNVTATYNNKFMFISSGTPKDTGGGTGAHTHTGPSHTHAFATSSITVDIGGENEAWLESGRVKTATGGGTASKDALTGVTVAGGDGATGAASAVDLPAYVQINIFEKD